MPTLSAAAVPVAADAQPVTVAVTQAQLDDAPLCMRNIEDSDITVKTPSPTPPPHCKSAGMQLVHETSPQSEPHTDAHSDAENNSDQDSIVQIVQRPVHVGPRRRANVMLESWLMENGCNLYPAREVKERIAKQFSLEYNQVNRWFANRRRRHHNKVPGQPVGPPPKRPYRPQQLFAQKSTDNSGTCSPADMNTMHKPAFLHLPDSQQMNSSATVQTPPALQALHPLLMQLAQGADMQHQNLAYMQWLQAQPLIVQLQQQQQSSGLRHNSAGVSSSSSSTQSSPSAQTSAPAQDSAMQLQCTASSANNNSTQHLTAVLTPTYQHKQLSLCNLTEAESLAVYALADLARAPA